MSKDKEELALKDRKFSVICDEIKIKDEIIKKTINVFIFFIQENQALIEKNSNLHLQNEKLEKENKELV